MITTILSVLSLVIWIFLLLGRRWFWRVSKLQAEKNAAAPQTSRVVAIVPARNEADVLAESVSSLQHQQFDGQLDVIVVDDNSSDGTGGIARSLGVTVVSGAPLIAGWTGKLWALQQGVEAASTRPADFFLFTDADIRHDVANVSTLVALAETRHLDLVSFMVKLHCTSWQEKLIIPAFVFFFFMLYPPLDISSERSTTAGAAGGCILIRPSALKRIGGLHAIGGELIDDCSLARSVKQSGGRLWLGLTEWTGSIRPYSGLAELGQMISRSAFRQLNHSSLLLIGSITGLLLTYLVPPLLTLNGKYMALFAWALMTVCYLPMVRFYRLNPLWALSLPLTACFYAAATIHSAVSYWTGRGGVWKGRVQDG